jgi:hypothetical protein
MKRIIIICFLISVTGSSFAQNYELGFNANFGLTSVDVEEAMEKTLEDWNQFHFAFGTQFLIKPAGNFKYGGALAFNRLYYWEEYYTYPGQVGYSNYYRWGTISTVSIGGLIEKDFNKIFLLGGLNFHIFTNGSGVTPGIKVGAGYKINIGASMILPLGLQIEPVFGSATPITLAVNSGLRFQL